MNKIKGLLSKSLFAIALLCIPVSALATSQHVFFSDTSLGWLTEFNETTTGAAWTQSSSFGSLGMVHVQNAKFACVSSGTTVYVPHLESGGSNSVLWVLSSSDNSTWTNTSISNMFSGPAPNPAAGFAAFTDASGSPWIFYGTVPDNFGQPHVIAITKTNGTWKSIRVDTTTAAVPYTGTELMGYIFGNKPTIWYVNSAQDMEEAFLNSSGTWTVEDIGAVAGAPSPYVTTPIVGFQNGSQATIWYDLNSSTFQEIWWTGSTFKTANATVSSGAQTGIGPASNQIGFTGYEFGSVPTIYYVDDSSHVTEIFLHGSTWNSAQADVEAGTPGALPQSPLTGYALGAVATLFYFDSNNQLREIWWNGTQWQTILLGTTFPACSQCESGLSSAIF